MKAGSDEIGNLELRPVVIVSGPTACGKSELACEIAAALQGEVINLDSVQIYSGLNIGSAKPEPQVRSCITHHLIDALQPGDQCNAGRYLELALESVSSIRERQRLPVFAGGTTMYLTALLHGLAPMPSADPELRQNLSQLGNTELHNMLRELDSESAAALHMNDRIRVIRAIEITKLSRIARSQSSSRHAFLQQLLRAVILVPCWRRDRLSERIRQRCRRMLEQGLIEETRTTIAKYGDDLNVLRAPGYRQARQFLRGELQLPEVDLKMFQHTRQYAKRQITYWRNEPPKRGWLCLPEQDFKRDKMSRLRSAKPAADFKSLALTIPQLLVRLSDMVSKPLERNQVWFLDGEQLFSEPRSGGQPWIQRLQ